MAGVISGICFAVRTSCEIANTVDSIIKFRQDNREGYSRRLVSIALQGMAVISNLTKAGASYAGASHKTLSEINVVEVVARVLKVPFEGGEILEDEGHSPKAYNKILALIVATVRSIIDGKVYYQNHLLSLTPEELAKFKEPIYKPGTDEIIGFKEKTHQDCLAALETDQTIQRTLELAESTLHLASHSNVADQIANELIN